jgi:hypothetical protein
MYFLKATPKALFPQAPSNFFLFASQRSQSLLLCLNIKGFAFYCSNFIGALAELIAPNCKEV